MPFGKTLRLLEGVAKERITDPVLFGAFKDLLRRAGKADEKRNQLVHSLWAVPLGLLFAKEAVRLKPSPNNIDHAEASGPKEVTMAAQELRAVVDDFAYFWPKFSGQLKATP